jgi:hypothetical protein
MLNRFEILALKAATSEKEEASSSWNELMSELSFDEIESSIARILPSIFSNLDSSKQATILEYNRLKGSYKHTWAKNSAFIHKITPLVEKLKDAKIHYVVLKGGALNFINESTGNRIGDRIMGDVDILIRKKDFALIQEILRNLGYVQKFSAMCTHNKMRSKISDVDFINNDGTEIDIHILESRFPNNLFKEIYNNFFEIDIGSTKKVNVPIPELILCHALIHANVGLQSSDKTQGLIDVYNIAKKCNNRILTKYIHKLGILNLIEDYDLQIRNLGIQAISIKKSKVINLFYKVQNMLRDMKVKVIILKRTIYGNYINLSSMKMIYISYTGSKKFLYIVWLYLGKLWQIERTIIKFFGPFYRPVSNLESIRFDSVGKLSNDWRISFEATRKISLEIQSEIFNKTSFIVYLNGLIIQVTEFSKNGTLVIEGLNKGVNEVSLRVPIAGCRDCDSDLSSANIKFKNL